MTAYEMRISDWSSDVCSSDLVRERREWIFGVLPHARSAVEPAPGGDVGDGVGFADNIGPAFEVFVQDLVVALRLAPIPVHRIVEVPGRRELEMHGLAGERAEARGEEQEPGEQLRSVFGRAQKLPSLLGEIDQDRGGVEDPRLAGAGSFGVDDSGNLAVRIDRSE